MQRSVLHVVNGYPCFFGSKSVAAGRRGACLSSSMDTALPTLVLEGNEELFSSYYLLRRGLPSATFWSKEKEEEGRKKKVMN